MTAGSPAGPADPAEQVTFLIIGTGFSGLGTGSQSAFFSAGSATWASTHPMSAALKSGWHVRSMRRLIVSSSKTRTAGGICIAQAEQST